MSQSTSGDLEEEEEEEDDETEEVTYGGRRKRKGKPPVYCRFFPFSYQFQFSRHHPQCRLVPAIVQPSA